MEGACKLGGRVEECMGSEETSEVPGAEQETAGVTQTSLY